MFELASSVSSVFHLPLFLIIIIILKYGHSRQSKITDVYIFLHITFLHTAVKNQLVLLTVNHLWQFLPLWTLLSFTQESHSCTLIEA